MSCITHTHSFNFLTAARERVALVWAAISLRWRRRASNLSCFYKRSEPLCLQTGRSRFNVMEELRLRRLFPLRKGWLTLPDVTYVESPVSADTRFLKFFRSSDSFLQSGSLSLWLFYKSQMADKLHKPTPESGRGRTAAVWRENKYSCYSLDETAEVMTRCMRSWWGAFV